MANTVSYKDTLAIQAFLRYLNKNYSKRINAADTYLIAAVAAWWRQEGRRVVGNNPFNIRPGMTSFMASGVRKGPVGKFLVFSSLAKGFEAAAYLLIHGNKAYGYRLAIAALKQGGNQGAVDFLAALAMSSWSATNYGAANWNEAYSPKQNHLLRNYIAITGVQLQNPRPKPKKPPPELPRDFNFRVQPNNYLDPWGARQLYAARHKRVPLGVDGTPLKR